MLALLPLLGCEELPSADSARRWAERHDTTLQAADLQLQRLLRKLPSLPGDEFGCHDLTLPPGLPEAEQEALRASLCRQREALWNADRHDAEEERGTAYLNAQLQEYGVVGVELTVAGPAGVEWSDHRGIWALSGQGATAATDGVAWDTDLRKGEPGGVRLGWGEVTVGLASISAAEPAPHPAFEWRLDEPWHQAMITVRLIVLADGAPDATFIGQATAN